MCGVLIDPHRVAVLGLHWQVNVIQPEGFFGPMLAEPIAASGVVDRAVRFHHDARAAGAALHFVRFTIPEDEGALVRNTGFMRAVADAQDAFRPDAPGSALVPRVAAQAEGAEVVDNQKLSGLAGSDLPERLLSRGVETIFLTGVATNLTVEQTARHATDLGFTTYVVADCVAAGSDDVHQASLANLELTTAGCPTADEVSTWLA